MKISSGIILIISNFYALALIPSAAAQQTSARSASANPAPLVRNYVEGEAVAYHMKASNQGHLRTIRYEAQADGAVKKNSSGKFVEEFKWTNLVVDGNPVALSPGSSEFRETLSLAPGFALTIPNVSQVQPMLMGPIFDLLTFYADLSLVMSQPGLKTAGDHAYFERATPNSWADGSYTILGEDSIDFDMTLKSIDSAKQIATVLVRHVPPAHPQVKLPAEWMKKPVAGTPNNWVEVDKTGEGKYSAQVGKETFDVVMEVSLATGKLISATMENPVEVLQRDCTDAALSACGDPVRYQIMRKISVN